MFLCESWIVQKSLLYPYIPFLKGLGFSTCLISSGSDLPLINAVCLVYTGDGSSSGFNTIGRPHICRSS